MIIRISYLIILVCYKKYKGNFKLKFNFKFFFLVFGYGFLLSLIYIYFYALPTFLLLLVYPTKVITVVAYLATFVFTTSIIYSVCIRMIIIAFYSFCTVNKCTRVMTIIYIIIIFLLPFPMFIVVIQFLYSLVLGEASAISTGPYTVLSLVPTAAISVAVWLVKNKVFSSGTKEEDENKEPDKKKNENEDEKNSAINNGEALTLVVNEETPFNGNDQEVKTYGAASSN